MLPVVHSINIPVGELPRRLFELPPPHLPVSIAATGSEADSACRLLNQRSRQARLESEFSFGPTDPFLRLWEPPNFLIRRLLHPAIRPRLALCLACGAGREAVFLKAEGWMVTAVDLLPDALDQGRHLETRYTDEEPRIRWILADLNSDQFGPGANFELISMFLFFSPTVAAKLSSWLAPDGRVLVEAFSQKHRDATGRPSNPSLALPERFDPSLFPNLQPVSYETHEERGRQTIRAELMLR